MIYKTKQEALYQKKVNSSLVSTCNCKTDYWVILHWYACGADGQSGVQSRDYQNCSDGWIAKFF